LQRRVCFTELAPSALRAHSLQFGQFALEFETAVVRKLGGIPVFYIPTAKMSDGVSLAELGGLLVIQLLDAKRLADHIAVIQEVSNRSDVAPTVEFTIQYAENPAATAKFNLQTAEAKRTLEAVSHGVTPPAMLREGINAALSFFYPMDNSRHSKELQYYQQREWRITGNIEIQGSKVMRHLTPHEVEVFRSFDPEFFGRKLSLPPRQFVLSDESLMYPALGGQSVLELVKRVVVPEKVVEEAKRVLAKLKRPIPVVSLESLSS
jgi:hypothetical protein